MKVLKGDSVAAGFPRGRLPEFQWEKIPLGQASKTKPILFRLSAQGALKSNKEKDTQNTQLHTLENERQHNGTMIMVMCT